MSIALISDLDPQSDWQSFEQLRQTAHLLYQSGHQLKLLLRPETLELDVWPKKVEKLSPCPHWKWSEVLRSLPFWVQLKVDVLHFFPRVSAPQSRHAWLWLVPLLQNLHSSLIASSWFQWRGENMPSHLKQLFHLSDLILCPSESLSLELSSDPINRGSQHVAVFPCLTPTEENNPFVPQHLEVLKPFVYVPGRWEEWESPEKNLDQLLSQLQRWKGWVITGQEWVNEFTGPKLQQILRSHPLRDRLFFPRQMTSSTHRWLLENSQFVYAQGLKLNSLTLSQCLQEAYLWNKAIVLSSSQIQIHNLSWLSKYSRELPLGKNQLSPWIHEPEFIKELEKKMALWKQQELVPDPASHLNRIYSARRIFRMQ